MKYTTPAHAAPGSRSAGMIRSHKATMVSASVLLMNRHAPPRLGMYGNSGAAMSVTAEARKKSRRVICCADKLGSIEPDNGRIGRDVGLSTRMWVAKNL